MSVPPPMLAVPPPPVVQSNVVDPNTGQHTIMQPQNFMQNQPSIVTASQPPPMQQQIIPQAVHLQGNMVIQHQVQPNNVSVPPPGLHMKGLVHLQAPPPTSVHLSQPPPNIQIQPQQIVLNQAQPNYQYQYIQQTAPIQTTADGQQNQATIHIYQQPQGIVQQPQHTTQFNQFTTQPQTMRPPPQTQQYILQGNTAYMVPPPNMMIQHQQPPGQQNIIFQTANTQPTSQMQLQQVQISQAAGEQSGLCTPSVNTTASSSDTTKEEKSGSDCNESPVKEEKSENDNDNSGSTDPSPHPPLPQPPQLQIGQLPPQLQQPPPLPQHQPPSLQIRASQFPPTSTINTVTQMPPLMAVPPPMTCVQHIVGNTLITTSTPTQPQTHQIYNQIPVSIQQIQAPQQQIHVSTQNGQHFLVNAQQWQPQQQFQQVSQNGNIQSFQLTTAQPMRNPNNPNEIVMGNQIIGPTSQNAGGSLQPQQHILATTFNPHIPAPGMHVQLQPLTSVATQQTITMSDGQQHVIEQQSQQQQLPSHQMMMQPPLSGSFGSGAQQTPPTSQHDSHAKGNGPIYPQGNSPQPVPPPLPVSFFF